MDISQNLDLIPVGVATAAMVILGFVLFFNDQKSHTGRAFLGLALMTSAWSIFNYISYQSTNPVFVIWMIRIALFFAVWYAFFVFHLCYIFPHRKATYPGWYWSALIPCTILISILTLTPLVLSHIASFDVHGVVAVIENGPAIPLFGLGVSALNIAGIAMLVRKSKRAPKEKKLSYRLVLIGLGITLFLITLFNFVYPAILKNSQFVEYGALFVFPFIVLTSYAIIKHNLFDLKVLSTEILIFVLCVLVLFDVVTSDTLTEFVYKSITFVLLLGIGVLLIRSVRREVKQRNKLDRLAKRLEKANDHLKELDQLKTEFLSIATHQLRTPLSIIKGYISLLDEGVYGRVTKAQREIYHNIDVSNERLVKLVDEFLNVSRIEQGRTKYDFQNISIKEVLQSAFDELLEKARPKRITLVPHFGSVPHIVGDADRLRHCVFNFIDNAIKYSPTESDIDVRLDEYNKGIRFRVQDHGPGLDEKDIKNLFHKFYRSSHVSRDFEGTGLGIYVVKEFVEAHGGHVWATSEGIGKGSEFGFWIPKKPKKYKK